MFYVRRTAYGVCRRDNINLLARPAGGCVKVKWGAAQRAGGVSPPLVAKCVGFPSGANAPRSLMLLAYVVSPHKL